MNIQMINKQIYEIKLMNKWLTYNRMLDIKIS